MQIALVMPVKNEAEGLREILPQINRYLFSQILVVDGDSTDDSVAVCEAFGIKVIEQRGVGVVAAINTAYHYLQGACDALILFSPDGNSLPSALPNVCRRLKAGYDVVVASRYLPPAKSDDDDALTAIGNWLFTWAIRMLFGARCTDALVMFRGLSMRGIAKMQLDNPRYRYFCSWEVSSTCRYKRAGLIYSEIPAWEPKRIGGVRKMKPLICGFGVAMQILLDLTWRPK